MIKQNGLVVLVKMPHGHYLPGGGVDPGETAVEALTRELREELGFTLLSARFFAAAEQYHWSPHYQRHHRNIGQFFEVEARAPESPPTIPDHVLSALDAGHALGAVVPEFQKFILKRWLGI